MTHYQDIDHIAELLEAMLRELRAISFKMDLLVDNEVLPVEHGHQSNEAPR